MHFKRSVSLFLLLVGGLAFGNEPLTLVDSLGSPVGPVVAIDDEGGVVSVPIKALGRKFLLRIGPEGLLTGSPRIGGGLYFATTDCTGQAYMLWVKRGRLFKDYVPEANTIYVPDESTPVSQVLTNSRRSAGSTVCTTEQATFRGRPAVPIALPFTPPYHVNPRSDILDVSP